MEINLYVHGSKEEQNQVLCLLKTLIHDTRLDEALCLLQKLVKQGEDIMATLDETLAKVTEEDTKADSLIALLNGIKQQLADALSGANLPPSVQAKVDAVFNQATASTGKIQAALDANVPPGEPPPGSPPANPA